MIATGCQIGREILNLLPTIGSALTEKDNTEVKIVSHSGQEMSHNSGVPFCTKLVVKQ